MKSYKNFKIIGLILGLLLVVSTANASLLIEPHLGYNIHGSGDNGGYDYSYNGPQYGLRLGYQSLGLMAGFDYTHGSASLDKKNSAGTTTQDITTNSAGIFVGYNLPILLRFWGAYYFTDKTTFKSDDSHESGNAKELGVGFTALPFLSLNAAYRMIDHHANDYNEVVFSVSLPLTL